MCTIDSWKHKDSTVLVRSSWKHNGHWIRQRFIETHYKSNDLQYVSTHCAFQSLASALKPIREVSSVTSSSHALHGLQAGPLTGIAKMKLPAGLDDECVDALLILIAAKRHIFSSRLVACHYLPTVGNNSAPESSDIHIITSLPAENPKYGSLRTTFLPGRVRGCEKKRFDRVAG